MAQNRAQKNRHAIVVPLFLTILPSSLKNGKEEERAYKKEMGKQSRMIEDFMLSKHYLEKSVYLSNFEL